MPTSRGPTGVEPSALCVTRPRAPTAARMASRIVVPGITFVEPPCHVSVQPPAWLPMLSALLPAT
jgi:hypothetical protein